MKKNGAKPLIRTERSPFYQVLMLVNLTGRAFHEQYGRRLRIGLTEWRVMVAVADRPGISAQELSDYTGLDKMSVSRAVRTLAASKRLRRSASEADGRRLDLELTPAGWNVYRSIAGSGLEREKKVFGALSAAEQATFARLLARLLAAARSLD